MKKILTLCLALSLMTLTACSNQPSPSESVQPSESAQVSAQPSESVQPSVEPSESAEPSESVDVPAPVEGGSTKNWDGKAAFSTS